MIRCYKKNMWGRNVMSSLLCLSTFWSFLSIHCVLHATWISTNCSRRHQYKHLHTWDGKTLALARTDTHQPPSNTRSQHTYGLYAHICSSLVCVLPCKIPIAPFPWTTVSCRGNVTVYYIAPHRPNTSTPPNGWASDAKAHLSIYHSIGNMSAIFSSLAFSSFSLCSSLKQSLESKKQTNDFSAARLPFKGKWKPYLWSK